MSILNVNTIQPVGSGQTITVTAANISAPSATITAGGFTGNLTGNVTGTVNSSGIATFSNGVVVAAGSASAPSISPSGDSNTGIFFPAADTIAFAEGGVEAARIDSSGNLGIGTNNPTVFGTAYRTVQLNPTSGSTDGSAIRFMYDGGTANTNDLVIYTNSSQSYIRANGARNIDVMRNGSTVATFNANGIAFPSGLGIDFSATDNSSGTMTSELLDDYEVGTWTPTIAATSSNPTISYTSGEREGSYVKIGKLVHVDFWIRITSCSAQGSGDLRISGLPFSEGSNAFRGQANFERFDFTGATAGSGEHILGEVDGTVIEMRRRANTGSVSVISTGSIPGGVSFAIGAATYTTA